MRVELKGINTVKKRLRDGTVKTYTYAWKGKGAPAVPGKPGSPEFLAGYNEAIKHKSVLPEGELSSLIIKYTNSPYFNSLKDITKKSNIKVLLNIKKEFGDFPLSSFSDPRTLEILEEWHKNIAKRSLGVANRHWSQLAAMLAWGLKRGSVTANPCAGGGKVYSGSRIDKIWEEQHESDFVQSVPSHLVLALTLALWTGQREGDLVELRWSAYDGQYIRLQQQKYRLGQKPRSVAVPIRGFVKEMLDIAERESGVVGFSKEERHKKHILLDAHGRPWASAARFSAVFGAASRDAGVVDRTFHDLRGTAVTRLARAGCTVPQIATITGHSLTSVEAILDKHYLHRDLVLDKRVAYEEMSK